MSLPQSQDGVSYRYVFADQRSMAGSLGSKGSSGAFAHYVLALAVTTVPIPPDMSFTDASVLPTITGTAASALYDPDFLSLSYPPSHTAFSRSSPHDPLPESTGTGEEPTGTEEEEREKVVFVYGGSSGVGSSSIQLARASGYTVFTAAGQGNFEMVRRLGAAEIFDHKSPKIMADISAALSGKRLVGIVDSITTRETMIICRSIARSAGVGLVVGMLPGLEGVDSGVEYRMVNGTKFKGSKVARRIFKEYLPIALANHQIVSSPRAEVVGHGLDQIQNGLDKLREGVSGKKLVVDM